MSTDFLEMVNEAARMVVKSDPGSSCYVDFDARSKRTCMQLYVHEKFDSLSSHRRCAKILFWQRVQAKQGYYFGKGVQARRQEGSEI